jgi:hypothetical protein
LRLLRAASIVAAALLLRGCAVADTDHRFPEPPISPAWQHGQPS